MKLYNTQTKKVEEISPIKKGEIKMYACGPTVYNTPTIANLRTYINIDILVRWLMANDYKVKFVENITDIEDKIIKAAKENGLNSEDKDAIKKYTKQFEDDYFEALEKLNIQKAENYPHATDPQVISEMIKIIQGLLDNNYAYDSDDGVYFSIKNYKEYGFLSGTNITGVKEGARVDVDEYDKENAKDFALWKFKKEGEPSWEAPFGEGRPGWHIECSAMALKYLGEEIDIHAGGVDLIFPHHENEIAQSEAFTGKKFARYWFHPEHMMIDGQRMGKSLKNFYTIEDLEKKFKVEPLALRMLSLMSHYRERLNFTAESIQDAQNTLNNLRSFIKRLEKEGPADKKHEKILADTKKMFDEAMNNDLSMPKAMATIFELIKEVNKLGFKGTQAVYEYLLQVDKVLGLRLSENSKEIPESILLIVSERENARKSGDYTKADELRKKVEEQGFLIDDTPNGPIITS